MRFHSVTKLATFLTICLASQIDASEQDCDSFLTEEFFRSSTTTAVSACLGAGKDVHARNTDGNTALHLAAAYAPDAAVTRILLRAGADVELKNALGWTPMHMSAAFSTDPAQIATLAVWGTDVNSGTVRDDCRRPFRTCTTTPLHLAARRSDAVEMVTALLAAGAVSDIYAGSGLEDYNEELEEDRYLLPLHLAARHGDIETVILLLQAGADHAAADSGRKQRTALHYAASRKNGAIEMVQTLLDAGASADARDFEDTTPLMLAAAHSDDPAVFEVLQNKAEKPCSKDKRGADALEMNDKKRKDSGAAPDKAYWDLHEKCR